jgi:hypothetical protein
MAKEDLYSKYASVVPNFAARWHLFCKYFFTPEINNKILQQKQQFIYKLPVYTVERRSKQQEISAKSDKKTKPSYERTKYRHPVLEAVHATSGPAHIKIFIKAISSTMMK